METLLTYLGTVTDSRQLSKIKHIMIDIIALVFLATLSNANEWEEIEVFGKEHEAYLRKYLELPYGIPSHDTIQQVIAIVPPEFLEQYQIKWNELLNTNEGEKIKKILSLDGKTQRGNGNIRQKANHIVSAVDDNGFCIGEKRVDDKSNEITAIPELLASLNIQGHIITTDAMGTQREIVKKIRKKRADYVLALKGNQGSLLGDVALYFADEKLLKECSYHKTLEKARSSIEVREYWQSDDISWLAQRNEWAGLRSVAMTRNTITKNGQTTTETRYFISSLALDVKEIAQAVRSHWMVESYHWHLDVTFKEDSNHTLEKQAAYNHNIFRKLALNVLKLFQTGGKALSLSKKRFMIGTNPEKYLEFILDM